jgi:hypothetical protein
VTEKEGKGKRLPLNTFLMRLFAPTCEAQRRVFRHEQKRLQAYAEDLRRMEPKSEDGK